MHSTHDRRGFIVKTGAALIGGIGILGTGQAAQASTASSVNAAGDSSLPPLAVRLANQSGNTITLAWDPPPNYDLKAYTITVSDNGTGECFGAKSGVTMKRLRSGMTHELTVVYKENPVINPNPQTSAPSQPVRVALPPAADTVPPAAPMNARVVFDPNIISWNLFWDESTDDVTPQADLQYDIVFDNGLSSYDVPMGQSVYAESGFIRAVDSAGNRSALSNHWTS
ncbi:fibronectin type III domain-containing protein [Actinopolymorpha pittospori]|uniref:Fibronectin type-III domain-containing protein n=1 Tax=Actinopolymorpha pittospori TaxID=648752 RepID=A0A927MNT8_9ACTN|nr:fibronectin type III domain-containing protein [Actinopolymorpha pittospori]MBE1603656.1 hypothetical protein [Actinopolymorpha pittospori]